MHGQKNIKLLPYVYVCLQVKYRYSCQILIKLKFSRQIFKKCSNIKFNENPSSGNRVVPCGRTDGRTDREDRQTDRQTEKHEVNNLFS